MKKILNLLLVVLSVLFFSACAGKNIKEFGGTLATSGGGNPIAAGIGLAVGGTLYGIGSLVEGNEPPTKKYNNKNLNTEKSVSIYETKLNDCIKSRNITDFNAQDGYQWNREDIQPQLKDCHLRIKNGEDSFENTKEEL
jgi:hypothetical protein